MLQWLDEKLRADVEGKCVGQYGYIICVLNIIDTGSGTVIPGDGSAEFLCRYRAIVFKPFKGEVLEGIVDEVSKMGFFVEVGPLRVFVSSHLIGASYKFDPSSTPPSWVSSLADPVIEKNTRMRLKVVGTRVDATEIFGIATIKEDHLGVIA